MYRVAKGVRSAHGPDGAVVLDLTEGQMFNLNPVGSYILQLLERGENESTIAEEISEKFEVSKDIAKNDLREFLESLQQYRLLADFGSTE